MGQSGPSCCLLGRAALLCAGTAVTVRRVCCEPQDVSRHLSCASVNLPHRRLGENGPEPLLRLASTLPPTQVSRRACLGTPFHPRLAFPALPPLQDQPLQPGPESCAPGECCYLSVLHTRKLPSSLVPAEHAHLPDLVRTPNHGVIFGCFTSSDLSQPDQKCQLSVSLPTPGELS